MAGSWFGKSSAVLQEVQGTASHLGVFTLTLTGVADPFDPDPAWDRRYGGRPEIAERLTGDSDFRLQAALDGCRNSVFERDAGGRFREITPVFTDVVMWIPEVSWRADSMRGGSRIQGLQHTLGALHTEKFSKSLPETRAPRYTIMSDRNLPPDSVAFQFGFGVFIPGADDVLEADIGVLSPGSTEVQTLPPWLFWHDGAQTRRPVGVYRGQRSLLISGSDEGPIRPDLWFSRRKGHVLVNLNEADAERLYADSDEIRVVEWRELKESPGAMEWRVESQGENGVESLWVRITPRTPSALSPLPPALPRAASRTAEKPEAPPANPEHATPISSRFSLHLAGIALFRIDPKRMPGLQEWMIHLDDAGRPIGEAGMARIDEPTCLALRARAGSHELEYRPAGATGFETLPAIPCSLATAHGGKLELLAPPVPERYRAILMLQDDLTLPLSPEPLVLGRASSASTAVEPDLPVQVLDHPRSARWQAGVPHAAARLDAIELSRRHLTVRLDGEHLEVGMDKGSTPAFALDEDGIPLTEIAPQSPEIVRLEPGQHLLVGGYVFRFQRESAQAIASTAVHIIPS